MTDSEDEIIRFQDVSFSYTGSASISGSAEPASNDSLALSDVSFSVSRGEFVCIAGTNGSGKSTIAKLIDGLLLPGSGSVEVLGVPTDTKDIEASIRQHIGYVFQDPMLQSVATIVSEEVAFGPENCGVGSEDIRRRVDTALASVGMQHLAECDVNTLSGGQLQRVSVASALAMEPDILILDEATSMLDQDASKHLLNIVRELHRKGMTVISITHDRDEMLICERLIVMYGGKLLFDGAPCDDAISRLFPPYPTKASLGLDGRNHTEDPSEEAIKFEDVWYSYANKPSTEADYSLKGVNLTIEYGSSVAIVGPNGGGKSTLIKHMNGLFAPTKGLVAINGIPTSSKQGANTARRYAGLVMQYPERQLFGSTVLQDVSFGPRSSGLSQAEANECAMKALDKVGLDAESFAHRNPFTLSGGEMRRVAIAGVIAMQPKALILDEPCASLDPETHIRFLEMIAKMIDEGITVIMVTHDMRDAELLSDRIIRIEDGRIVP